MCFYLIDFFVVSLSETSATTFRACYLKHYFVQSPMTEYFLNFYVGSNSFRELNNLMIS